MQQYGWRQRLQQQTSEALTRVRLGAEPHTRRCVLRQLTWQLDHEWTNVARHLCWVPEPVISRLCTPNIFPHEFPMPHRPMYHIAKSIFSFVHSYLLHLAELVVLPFSGSFYGQNGRYLNVKWGSMYCLTSCSILFGYRYIKSCSYHWSHIINSA